MENQNLNSNQVAQSPSAIMPELQNMVDGFKNLSSILAWVEGARELISDLRWENEQLKSKLEGSKQTLSLEDIERLVEGACRNQIEWGSVADEIGTEAKVGVEHWGNTIELEVEIDSDDVEDAMRPTLIKALVTEAKEQGIGGE